MKKNLVITIITVILLIGVIFLGIFIKLHLDDSNNNEKSDSGTLSENNNSNMPDDTKNITTEEKLSKMDILKKKLALKGLISKGELSYENQEYTTALVDYLKILKEIPNDESTINKVGEIYYNLKNFKKAYSYFSKIKTYSNLDKDKAVKSLFAFTSINDQNKNFLIKEIDSLGLNEEQLFYYKTALNCKNDFSMCKKEYQDYFAQKKDLLVETGSTENTSKFKELYNIETALINYENFQLDDISYKGALVSGAFFENGLYSIAIITAQKLLEEKPDYKPLLLLIAKSNFELGDYIDAKLYLIKYNKLEKNDPNASYLLGIVYEKLHEYVLSTIHYNKAMELGYKDSLNVYKRILFNYYELGDLDKMLETLKTMVDNNKEELSVNDYSLAIYYNLINDKIKEAKNYAQMALTKYPESEIINGYLGWILMDETNTQLSKSNISGTGTTQKTPQEIEQLYAQSQKYIDKSLEIDGKNPMLTLVKGKLESNKGNSKTAFLYFKKTLSLDKSGDFGKMAKQELNNIELNKK